MNIAVCDDEKFFRDEIRNAIYTYSNLYRYEFVVEEYTCGEDLLSSSTNYDIVFLDYQMGDIDGLETAKALRKKDFNCIIIFMTNYPHFMRDAFAVDTYRFFIKPLNTDELYEALNEYLIAYGNDYPIHLKIGRDTICVQTREIVYLLANNKKCFINLDKKKYHCAKTMAEVSALLPQNIFYKVHKSFIVNLNYINYYDNKHIYLKNGEVADIGRKYFPSFKDAYKVHVKGRSI